MCVGIEEQIPNVGDYFLYSIGAENLIIVRGKDKIRTFYNVCCHRGTRLCKESQGHFEKDITCPYRGWRYGLDKQRKVASL